MDAQQARTELYEVMSQDAELAAKAEQALALGEKYLGVDNAHLTESAEGGARFEIRDVVLIDPTPA